jgi:hypothetical protein
MIQFETINRLNEKKSTLQDEDILLKESFTLYKRIKKT